MAKYRYVRVDYQHVKGILTCFVLVGWMFLMDGFDADTVLKSDLSKEMRQRMLRWMEDPTSHDHLT